MSTTIPISLPRAARATLTIFNSLGQRVRTLFDAPFSAGDYLIVWDGRNDQGRPVSSGPYFYRLQHDHHSQQRKMLLLK